MDFFRSLLKPSLTAMAASRPDGLARSGCSGISTSAAACSRGAISFQLTHRTVRCGVAVERDCPRAALVAFDRFTKERLGGPPHRAWGSAGNLLSGPPPDQRHDTGRAS